MISSLKDFQFFPQPNTLNQYVDSFYSHVDGEDTTVSFKNQQPYRFMNPLSMESPVTQYQNIILNYVFHEQKNLMIIVFLNLESFRIISFVNKHVMGVISTTCMNNLINHASYLYTCIISHTFIHM